MSQSGVFDQLLLGNVCGVRPGMPWREVTELWGHHDDEAVVGRTGTIKKYNGVQVFLDRHELVCGISIYVWQGDIPTVPRLAALYRHLSALSMPTLLASDTSLAKVETLSFENEQVAYRNSQNTCFLFDEIQSLYSVSVGL